MLGLPGGKGLAGKALAGKALYGLGCVFASCVLVAAGAGYYAQKAADSIGTSNVLAGGASTGPMNILIMGLESRTYWNGTSISHHLGVIMNTGTSANDNGGNAANTLILLHIFAGGKKAVGFSIPRDDYVQMVGTLGYGPKMSKVDNAYGYAMAQQMSNDYKANPHSTLAQRSLDGNEAGRLAEVETVQAMTGVKIDKFAELNLVGFYELAQAFNGIEVCVLPWRGGNTPSGYLGPNANLSDPVTSDSGGTHGSGSKVKAGIQHLTPDQALAFVRNRHTVPGGDIGRTYRQQAVLDYVLSDLKSSGALSDVGKLTTLVATAKDYLAVPKGWNLVEFGGEIDALTGNNLSISTLPISGQENAPYGIGAVNTVNVPAIQAQVQQAFSTPPGGITTPAPSAKAGAPASSGRKASPGTKASATPAATALPPSKVTVDVVNNGAPTGTARGVLTALHAKGYAAGTAGDPPAGTAAQSLTTVSYGAGAAVNAAAIAKYFGTGITVTASSSVPADHVLVTLGVATLGVPQALSPTTSPSATGSPTSSPTTSSPGSTASGGVGSLTAQEKEWEKEAQAKYGIPCEY
jgi:anionic cell wall polymer biosynthesis LytR-Cps2A-Psr (LCP) family protein